MLSQFFHHHLLTSLIGLTGIFFVEEESHDVENTPWQVSAPEAERKGFGGVLGSVKPANTQQNLLVLTFLHNTALWF